MILQPVLMEIPRCDDLTGPQRVERQRAFARLALSECAALCGLPDDDPWPRDDNGAPMPRDGLHWSVAHKPSCAVAVIADQPVGIDIERITPRRDDLFDAVAGDQEWQVVGGKSWPGFYRVWTAKEAALKANSAGIGHLRACRILHARSDRHLTLEFEGCEWQIEHYGWADHLAAVTVSGEGIQWRRRTTHHSLLIAHSSSLSGLSSRSSSLGWGASS